MLIKLRISCPLFRAQPNTLHFMFVATLHVKEMWVGSIATKTKSCLIKIYYGLLLQYNS